MGPGGRNLGKGSDNQYGSWLRTDYGGQGRGMEDGVER